MAVDPLMMYWNRDMLSNAGFLTPPQTWEDLVNAYAPQLIERDFDRSINQSIVAFGEYNNVENAFGTLSMLLVQGGTEGVTQNGSIYQLNINRNPQGGRPLTAAIDFYARFAQPNNTLYSWNRLFSSDRLSFLAEDLVLYFGYGSEGVELERANPNLNFDIAEVPQGAAATVRRTYGKFYSLALIRASDNPRGASIVAARLAGPALAQRIANDNQLAPVHRSTVANGSNDTYGRLYYTSAPIARAWLNPRMNSADVILAESLRSVTESRENPSSAASDVMNRLELEYN
jgi:ABC-type glycerol-3-phosphate transport system substrate-binding protein